MSYNQTREERINALRERFGKKLVAKASTHTVDDIIQDLNKRDLKNGLRPDTIILDDLKYDKAQKFKIQNPQNEYK